MEGSITHGVFSLASCFSSSCAFVHLCREYLRGSINWWLLLHLLGKRLEGVSRWNRMYPSPGIYKSFLANVHLIWPSAKLIELGWVKIMCFSQTYPIWNSASGTVHGGWMFILQKCLERMHWQSRRDFPLLLWRWSTTASLVPCSITTLPSFLIWFFFLRTGKGWSVVPGGFGCLPPPKKCLDNECSTLENPRNYCHDYGKHVRHGLNNCSTESHPPFALPAGDGTYSCQCDGDGWSTPGTPLW